MSGSGMTSWKGGRGGLSGARIPAITLGVTVLAVAAGAFFFSTSGCKGTPEDARAGAATTAATEGLDRSIRVLLLDKIGACEIAAPEAFEVIDPATGNVLLRSDPQIPLKVRFEGSQIVLLPLDRRFDAAAIELVSTGARPLQIGMPKGPVEVAGTLRFVQQGPSTGGVVNVLDMETYLLGVLPPEMPASFHEQAMRAQVIAARTYAWYNKLSRPATSDWDVKATESSQMYIGLPRRMKPEAERAVKETAGLVCTWDSPDGERIFCTYYSSTCGGSTQDAGPVKNDASIPPLAGGVPCDWCKDSPSYRWDPVRLEKRFITMRLREKYSLFRSLGLIDSISIAQSTPEGRPVRFLLKDEVGRTAELEAENFRLAVNPDGRTLKSTWFTPVVERQHIVFTEGRGFGHGMGLCQYGADGLARAGRNAVEILTYYYPGSRVTRAY
jgi:stage II sporulation protein D